MAHQTSMLLAWLNDAYAMELAQEEMLERFIGDFKDHRDIQKQLEIHLEETKQQAEDVKTCIKLLGGKVSKTKSVIGSITGKLQGLQTGPFKDELVKNMIMLHAGEHFEHACYMALAEGAREVGQADIVEVCERIVKEEKETADWAEKQLPQVVQSVMQDEPAMP